MVELRPDTILLGICCVLWLIYLTFSEGSPHHSHLASPRQRMGLTFTRAAAAWAILLWNFEAVDGWGLMGIVVRGWCMFQIFYDTEQFLRAKKAAYWALVEEVQVEVRRQVLLDADGESDH